MIVQVSISLQEKLARQRGYYFWQRTCVSPDSLVVPSVSTDHNDLELLRDLNEGTNCHH